MGTQNYAYPFGSPAVPFAGNMAIRTPYGTLLPPGCRVTYLRSTGVADLDPPDFQNNLVTTLASALQRCRAGYGDVVYVLPGHAETVSDATMLTNVVAGTKIIGMGDPRGEGAPTFTFAATTAQWLIDQNDVLVQGIRFDMTGLDAVAAGIMVNGVGCSVVANYFECETTSLQATAAIEFDGAERCLVANNHFYGTGSDDVTSAVNISGANDGNDIQIVGNVMIGGWHATRGAINIAGAVKRLFVAHNYIENLFAGTVCIAVADVISTGHVAYNTMGVVTNATTAASAKGIVVTGSSSLLSFFENYCTDEELASGILSPVAAT